MAEYFPNTVRSGIIFNEFLNQDAPDKFVKVMDKEASLSKDYDDPDALVSRQYFFDNRDTKIQDELLYEEADSNSNAFVFALRFKSSQKEDFEAFSAFLESSADYSLMPGESDWKSYLYSDEVLFQDDLYTLIATLKADEDGTYHNGFMLRLLNMDDYYAGEI